MPSIPGRFSPWLLLACLLAACGGPPEAPLETDDSKPLIVATLPPLGFIAREVVGESARVEVLIPAGRDPHGHEPSPRDLDRALGAELFFQVGHPDLRFEDRVRTILEVHGGAPELLSLSELVEGSEEAVSLGDPHLWLSPPVLAEAAHELASRFEGAEAGPFVERAEALDRELAAVLEAGGCDVFLVDHPAWGAFADHYGLRQLAIEAGGKEPGPATLARLLEDAREAGVRQVIVEPGMPLQSARTVARELDAEIVELDPLAPDVLATLRRAAELIAGGCDGE